MKILHLGKYGPPFFGGIENFMMDLGEACVEQGHEVAAIVHHHQFGGAFEQVQINGMTLYRVPTYSKLMFAPVSPTFGYYLNRVIKAFKPDILHLHLPNTSAFFALALARAKPIPWVVHWHSDVLGDDSPWFLKTFYPLYRPFESAVLKRACKVIATSEPYLASSIALQALGKSATGAKCAVIGLGSKALAGEPKTAEKTQHCRPLKLLIVGRLTYYKGHRYLLEALGLLKTQGLTDINLSIVGSGELKSSLEQQIERLGLTAQVTLLGKLSDEALAQQFNSSDCFCLPSTERTEAFGVVLMEAAAHGLPAMVSDVPGSGMSWVVQDGITGLVVKRCDGQAWADAIKRLYQQPQQLNYFAEAALARFNQHFQISNVATQTISLYNRALFKNTPEN
jgi:glycosyltransferase involved in cell wall biosynthesis